MNRNGAAIVEEMREWISAEEARIAGEAAELERQKDLTNRLCTTLGMEPAYPEAELQGGKDG